MLCRATDAVDAVHLAERLRRAVESERFVWRAERFTMTISMGVATSCESGIESVKELIERADQRLYVAKRAGRNRVVGPTLPRDLGDTQSG